MSRGINGGGARRAGKIKVDHSIIPGLRNALEQIEGWSEITTIIPGKIKNSSSHHELRIEVQYPTPSGIKCIAKGFGRAQKVFFVTSNVDELTKKIKEWKP